MTPDDLADLANPAISLPQYGHVGDQENNGEIVLYDPHRITLDLQQTILGYMSAPPRLPDTGETLWLTVLASRQSGKSTTCAICLYPPVSYTPNTDAVLIADTQDRADYLFERVTLCHERWPESIRTERKHTNETRSIRNQVGSRYRVLSGHGAAVGIGQSVDWFVGSELPYWKDAGTQMSLVQPSMFNRKNSRLVLESTPAPLNEPSAQWWMDHCYTASQGKGKYIYAFFPFWDSYLNRRPWRKGDVLDNEEIRMMERYGPLGMTEENISFRRFTMETDAKIKRNYELFGVYYPFDDVSCWIAHGLGVVPRHALERHISRPLLDEIGDYVEFRPPDPEAIYIIGVDPAGHGVDHGSFQVLEVWDEEWEQVAVFGGRVDPLMFARKLAEVGKRYNEAKIVVERNGVGVGTITMLRHIGYRNLYYEAMGKPGVWKSSKEEWLSILVDALMDKLVLNGKDTVKQIQGYRHDKMIERTQREVLISGGDADTGRRGRHHWDKVSSLMVACTIAPRLPRRYKRKEAPKIVEVDGMTWDQSVRWQRTFNAMRAIQARRRRG